MVTQTIIYLDIKGSELVTTSESVEKYFTFGDKVYLFKIKVNDSGIYTVEVWNQRGTEPLFSNKITYGQALMDSKNAPFQDLIIPLNLNKLNGLSNLDEINEDTLGDQVKLCTSITEVES